MIGSIARVSLDVAVLATLAFVLLGGDERVVVVERCDEACACWVPEAGDPLVPADRMINVDAPSLPAPLRIYKTF